MSNRKPKLKYVLVNKCGKRAESGDLTYLAEQVGCCDDTLRSRLPYWEDSDWILSVYRVVPSRRGRRKAAADAVGEGHGDPDQEGES